MAHVLLPRARVLALRRLRPELAVALIEALVGRVRQLSERVEEGASFDGRTRLCRLLLRAAEAEAEGAEDRVELGRHLPQAVLWAQLGLSRQTVNRLLRGLQDADAIEVKRARLTVTSRARLRALGGTERLRARCSMRLAASPSSSAIAPS